MTSGEMRCGAVLPGGTATEQVEMGVLAERAGWDGVFTWEAAYGVDPWTVLAAIAARTSRVKLGTMLTPLPWRRPWKVASQVATLDQISRGRAILAVGVGATDTNLPDTGEETGIRARAELLDEGIDLIRALWEGKGSYDGRRYRYHSGRFDLVTAVRPVQDRIPIWVVGVWPARKSMRRVLRCDGLIPQFSDAADEAAWPDLVRAATTWLAEKGARRDLDVIADGETPAGDPAAAAARAADWARAGCTWWLETRWGVQEDLAERISAMRERLEAGPPRDAGGPR
ncbi:MAG TPA: LLM class flavin-dependent oxidoreductase [Streptosporangiaceae bacterium]|nr:LLM class flavin-dependent oxidoreductase [Streptosporangiaceae bacterium]